MTPTDKPRFSQALLSLAIASGKELHRLTYQVYSEALKALTIDQFEGACRILIDTWKHPGQLPTPGQIKEAILGDGRPQIPQFVPFRRLTDGEWTPAFEELKKIVDSLQLNQTRKEEDTEKKVH